MSLTDFFGLNEFFCCYVLVPSVLLLTKWRDVYLSERVKFECSISNSSQYTFSWTRDGHAITASESSELLSVDGSLLTVVMGAPERSSGSYTCKAIHKATRQEVIAANSEMLTVHREWTCLFVCQSILHGSAVIERKSPGSSLSLPQEIGLSQLCTWNQIWEPCTLENLFNSPACWLIPLAGTLLGNTIQVTWATLKAHLQ